ncbi:hypothetical protein QA644_34540 (plasmid) [Rhizobium sp. CC1099]|uniref:hypothetical protein n=1 Tax=Rhizobium sp. CC1099 TaxID=3039160 RepID=UPI0024B1F957|nr:hypothetical protein [Rhizobium sp. CC1099]WFU92017.1 hypothetical protein QA644_34540 [Rhizobium sp. CC1099]
MDYNDRERIWAKLDPCQASRHGPAARRFAQECRAHRRLWAEARKVTQISFKPNWTKHAKAAPFRRNDEMLSVMPAGLIAFPGSGITGNLADKTRRLGIPVWRAGGD